MRKTLCLIFVLVVCGGTNVMSQSSSSPEADELDAKVISLSREGKPQDALPLAKRAVELRSKLSEIDAAAVRSLYNLGVIYHELSDFDSALMTFKKALETIQTVSPSDISTATILDRMGKLYFHKHDNRAAQDAYERALSVRTKILGDNHPEVMRNVLRLALFFISTGQDDEAAKLFDRFDRAKASPAEDLRKQTDAEIQQIACELRSVGNVAAADKLESRLSIVPVMGKSDDKDKAFIPEAINGRAVHLATPPYPPIAQSARASGEVRVHVVINETGQPIFACVLSGHPLLRAAAMKAAMESRFTPTLMNGKPVRVAGIIIYNFVAR